MDAPTSGWLAGKSQASRAYSSGRLFLDQSSTFILVPFSAKPVYDFISGNGLQATHVADACYTVSVLRCECSFRA